MATTALKGTPVNTVGELPAVGSKAPASFLTGADLSDLTPETFAGRRVILNIFPSIDTKVCATSVRKFNELASGLDNTVVVCASADLPFAASRFCGAEGLDNVVVGSSFRSDFGTAFGVELVESGMKGLLARSVVVIDADGTVLHSQLVPEIASEPDYDAALATLA
ncbi:thiol peroxidase [Raineyella fluvialis]|uniref:Thiol peroxidase n=1 Tax=Raineyella fluvialis TaxID=2662261 RepID=A0A5Q2FE43_9ACTN|nr:thiol peroxidase [Raineyella fluvialis]QGF24641.1 thiol peroxidase [Raineyella fluvialis]